MQMGRQLHGNSKYLGQSRKETRDPAAEHIDGKWQDSSYLHVGRHAEREMPLWLSVVRLSRMSQRLDCKALTWPAKQDLHVARSAKQHCCR